MNTCKLDGCHKPVKGLELCQKHYTRMWREKRRTNPDRFCTVGGCDKPVESRDLCNTHYAAWRRDHEQDGTKRKPCTVDGCDRPYRKDGLCDMHYRRVQRSGTTEAPKDTVKCGEAKGYYKHRREGTPPCQPCKDARAAYDKERRARNRELAKSARCQECGRPMSDAGKNDLHKRDGWARMKTLTCCQDCYVEPAKPVKPEREPLDVKPVAPTPELTGWMRGREERLAREARRKRAAQILANQGRRPAA